VERAATTEAPQTPRTPWGLVILLGSLTAMGPLAIDMYLPSLPAIGADLRASASQTQATVAAFLAGMAIGQFFYGPASDRFGRKPPILLGIVVYTLGSVGCAIARTPEQLILARFIQALGACAGGVVSRAVVRDQFNHTETARVLSLMMLIMGMAPILAPLGGGVLLHFGGWRMIFWTMAAFGVAVGLAAFFRLKESRSEETSAQAQSENPLRAYMALLGQPRLVGYGLAAALNGATIFAYIASSPELLIEIYKVPAASFGWVFGLNAAGLIGGNQINRILLRRRTPDQVLARASLVGVGIALALAVAAASGFGGKWTVLPLLFGLLATYGFLQGNTMAGALSIDPRRAGSISALQGGISFGAGALASAAVGVLHDGTPRPMALVMLASIVGSALAIHLLALPKRVQA
jgi:DHA1 family bicyclomycin/chloramphenicol resistance-like MFS transporter